MLLMFLKTILSSILLEKSDCPNLVFERWLGKKDPVDMYQFRDCKYLQCNKEKLNSCISESSKRIESVRYVLKYVISRYLLLKIYDNVDVSFSITAMPVRDGTLAK